MPSEINCDNVVVVQKIQHGYPSGGGNVGCRTVFVIVVTSRILVDGETVGRRAAQSIRWHQSNRGSPGAQCGVSANCLFDSESLEETDRSLRIKFV